MYQSNYLINSTLTLVSLMTMLGIALHGTQLDKATITAITPSYATTRDNGSSNFVKSDLHTHSERSSFSQVLHNLDAANPRVLPRRTHDRRAVHARKSIKNDYYEKF